MTRISLKEQYDNSSVIKQIADLTDRVDDYDTEIEEISAKADEAATTASAAKSTADAATVKNTEQDSRLDAVEMTADAATVKNTEQDSRLDAVEAKDSEQDAAIFVIQSKDSEQDSKIALIQAKDVEQDLSISTILDTDTKQDAAINALQTITNTLTNEVINSVNVVDGTQNGSIMVRLADVGGRVISSPSYPWGQVATFALKQGSEAGYVYGELTLSDGEVIKSNDYQILQVIESDIYVTSITLTPYPTTGKMGGEIGYSNGNVAQINVIDVPTAPGVTSNINDLLSRMGVAEASINSLDTRVKAIEDTPGVGAFTNTSRGTILGSTEDGKVSANGDGTGSVSGWSNVAKSADVEAVYAKSADVATTYATKVALAETDSTANDAQTKANGCFNNVTIDGNVLTFTSPDDTHVEISLPSRTVEIIDSLIETTILPITTGSASWVVGVHSNLENASYLKHGDAFVEYYGIRSGVTNKTAHYLISNSNDILTEYVNKLHSLIKFDDGTYHILVIAKTDPAIERPTLTYSLSSNLAPYVDFVVSDGEIISIETSPMYCYPVTTPLKLCLCGGPYYPITSS